MATDAAMFSLRICVHRHLEQHAASVSSFHSFFMAVSRHVRLRQQPRLFRAKTNAVTLALSVYHQQFDLDHESFLEHE